LEKEKVDHKAFALSHGKLYIGRRENMDAMTMHVNSFSHSPLVIFGDAGYGKSALLANWAFNYSQSHPNQ
jgi:hypothetical protein